MNITQALSELGATSDAISEENRRGLDERGYTLLPCIIDAAWLEDLRTRFEELCQREGPGAGIEVHQEKGTRRLSDLVNKGAVFDRVYTHPQVLACIHHVIGRDFKLSSLNARMRSRAKACRATPTGALTTTASSTSATPFGFSTILAAIMAAHASCPVRIKSRTRAMR